MVEKATLFWVAQPVSLYNTIGTIGTGDEVIRLLGDVFSPEASRKNRHWELEQGSGILTETHHSVTSERVMKSLLFAKLSPSFHDFTFVGCFLLFAVLWVTGCGPIQSTQAIGEGNGSGGGRRKASASEDLCPLPFFIGRKCISIGPKRRLVLRNTRFSREYARRGKNPMLKRHKTTRENDSVYSKS